VKKKEHVWGKKRNPFCIGTREKEDRPPAFRRRSKKLSAVCLKGQARKKKKKIVNPHGGIKNQREVINQGTEKKNFSPTGNERKVKKRGKKKRNTRSPRSRLPGQNTNIKVGETKTPGAKIGEGKITGRG